MFSGPLNCWFWPIEIKTWGEKHCSQRAGSVFNFIGIVNEAVFMFTILFHTDRYINIYITKDISCKSRWSWCNNNNEQDRNLIMQAQQLGPDVFVVNYHQTKRLFIFFFYLLLYWKNLTSVEWNELNFYFIYAVLFYLNSYRVQMWCQPETKNHMHYQLLNYLSLTSLHQPHL